MRRPGTTSRKATDLSRGTMALALTLSLCGSAARAEPSGVAIQSLPAPATSDARHQSDYRVNAGDELDISIWGEERMQRTTRVLPDGTIAFPLAGTVQASSRTIDDIAREIQTRIAPNYRSAPPQVTVTVRDTTGLRFYVVGKVRSPGSFAAGRPIDSLQALSMAGGLADFADVKNAVILRQSDNGQVVEPVRLAELLKGRRSLKAGVLPSPLQIMHSGDVLVIP